jgi:hypothetical protein
LIGDRLFIAGGRLHPATHTSTYRQKAQRSFAAEILCPFLVLDDLLDGDYTAEAQQDAADHFAVSPMTIEAQLKNHRRIDRDPSDFDRDGADFEFGAAAA